MQSMMLMTGKRSERILHKCVNILFAQHFSALTMGVRSCSSHTKDRKAMLKRLNNLPKVEQLVEASRYDKIRGFNKLQ